jgi:hypothetical protein
MPNSIDERDEITQAFHRADPLYQMHGKSAPKPYPGYESSMFYRRRLAEGLRKHSETFKNERINDSVTGVHFDLVETAIYDEARRAGKHPAPGEKVDLTCVTTTENGKTRREYFGSGTAAWEPFMAPVMKFKIVRPKLGR